MSRREAERCTEVLLIELRGDGVDPALIRIDACVGTSVLEEEIMDQLHGRERKKTVLQDRVHSADPSEGIPRLVVVVDQVIRIDLIVLQDEERWGGLEPKGSVHLVSRLNVVP